MRDNDQVLLEIRKVTAFYHSLQVLEATDLTLFDGEFMAILGPSGSGKTTILRLIGGFMNPTSGSILLDGCDIAGMPINKRPFNTVFQDYALFPHMKVKDNVAYGLMVRGVEKSEIVRRVAETLDLVALGNIGERYPSQLSGGQRQRIALARAIIGRPRLVLLDEPLGALDAELRHQMQRFLKELQREIKTTFLFVTHDQEEAVTMADRICVMNHGKIEQIGTPKSIYYQPTNNYVAHFFGDNNTIDVELIADIGALMKVRSGAAEFCCEAEPRGSEPGARMKLLVRPEAIRLFPDITVDNKLEASVVDVTFGGAMTHVTAKCKALSGQELAIKIPSRFEASELIPGREIKIGWSARECFLVN